MHVIMKHTRAVLAEAYRLVQADTGTVHEFDRAVATRLISEGSAYQCYPDGSMLQFEPYDGCLLSALNAGVDIHPWRIDGVVRTCRTLRFEEIKTPKHFPEFQQEETKPMNQLDTVLDAELHMQYLADPKCVEMDFAEWKRRQRPVPTNPQTHRDIGGGHE